MKVEQENYFCLQVHITLRLFGQSVLKRNITQASLSTVNMDGEALLGSSINDLINTKDDPEDLNIAEDSSKMGVVKIDDVSTDTTLELEDVGERKVEVLCVGCGLEGEERSPHLLSCLHTVCQSCVSSQCQECGQDTDPAHLVALDTQSAPTRVSESLVSLARLEVGQVLPQEMARLDSLLTDLQEETDNTRSLIQETYHSYRAILEQCRNYSMAELDKRHHRKELAIMEKMEEIDNTKRHLEMSLLWNEKNINEGHRNNVGKVISDRMESLMKYHQVKQIPHPNFHLIYLRSSLERWTKGLGLKS